MSQHNLNLLIGDCVRKSRESAGLSQAQLAKIAKVQQSMISRIETNTSKTSFCTTLQIIEIINKTAYENIIKALRGDHQNVSDNKYLDKYRHHFMRNLDIDIIKENLNCADNLHNNEDTPSVGGGEKKASIYPRRPTPAQQEIGLWFAAKRDGFTARNYNWLLAAA